jgi:hypothetical protein
MQPTRLETVAARKRTIDRLRLIAAKAGKELHGQAAKKITVRGPL